MKTVSMFAILLSIGSCLGDKILMIPALSTGHCLELMSIGKELLMRGHHVTLFAVLRDPSNCLSRFDLGPFKSQFKVLVPKVDPALQNSYHVLMDSLEKEIYESTSFIKFVFKLARPLMQKQCFAAFQDQHVLGELRKDKYDIGVVTAMPHTCCLFCVPKYLNISTVAQAAFIDPQDSMTPLQTNTLPNLHSPYTNRMSFHQRLLNTLSFFLSPLLRQIVIPTVDLSQYSDDLKGLDPKTLIRESVLFLENTDYIVDLPRALYPNFVHVGALTAGPGNPLPQDLQEWMDGSDAGVIVVSFGSVVNFIPQSITDKLMHAFRKLGHRVLFKHDKEGIVGNLKTVKWLPQNDILAHPHTKLFLSHCGRNGFWEGVYHGVPIMCLPFHSESLATAVKVERFGIGSQINIFDITDDELSAALNRVFSNNTITRNVRKMSQLLRDRPETPAQRAASAIEHVIKYGGNHLRPPPDNFSFITYIYADVWITIFLIAFILKCVIFSVCRRCRSKVPEKTKAE